MSEPVLSDLSAYLIGGRVERDVYGKTITPGKRAYLVVRVVGMEWCNVFQLAPRVRVNAIAPSLTASEMTKAMPEKVLDKMIASIPLRLRESWPCSSRH